MFRVPSWVAISTIAVLIVFAINRLSSQDIKWFQRLRRPRWLTFEWAIPFIWIVILICGGWSAYAVWETSQSMVLMACYALLEVLIMAYTPALCKSRSLTIGTLVGGLGFLFGLYLTWQIWPISKVAFGLLIPYLLWSPIGTFVTWQMIELNPKN